MNFENLIQRFVFLGIGPLGLHEAEDKQTGRIYRARTKKALREKLAKIT